MIDMPLPPLGEDLELIEGPARDDEEKYFLIRDGLLNRFIRVSEDAVRILSLWQPGMQVGNFCQFITSRGLEVAPLLVFEFLQSCHRTS